MTNQRPLVLTISIILMLLGLLPLSGQQQWSWPEKPENLQVLPSDWSGKRLSPVMRGFTRALGVRCSYCHVGKEGEPLSSYDFASDENPNKNRARSMLKMLGTINDELKNIEPSGVKRVNMWCHTCHAGKPKPMTLDEALTEVFERDGIDSTLAHYTALRERYYGRGAYDFGETSLNRFGYELLGDKQTASAIAIFKLNAKHFPESGNAWDSLAEAHFEAGDLAMAKTHYRKALELNPRNKHAEEMLQKIEQQEKDQQ